MARTGTKCTASNTNTRLCLASTALLVGKIRELPFLFQADFEPCGCILLTETDPENLAVLVLVSGELNLDTTTADDLWNRPMEVVGANAEARGLREALDLVEDDDLMQINCSENEFLLDLGSGKVNGPLWSSQAFVRS